MLSILAMAGLIASAPAMASDGQAVYESTCKMCHGAGLMGAPKFGDKADWGTRMAQGIDTLKDHAVKGFKGSKGMMPPKGGKSGLSNEEVHAAVSYMVDAAK
jgi:cytochrome c5